jgi:bifunctional non-homologous end joining protein LigD
MTEEKVSLYLKSGSSDKEYHVQLVAQDGAYMVLAQNGRRGGTLTPRKKTATPVAYAVAKKAYDKLVKEKLAEGYSTGEAGSVFIGTALEERFTGILPQLLNPVTAQGADTLLDDPAWVLQEKFDGHRRLVQRPAGQPPTGINRKGLASGLPEPVVTALQAIAAGGLVLDGELMGDVFAIFDVLEYGGDDLRHRPYSERLGVLAQVNTALAAAQAPGAFVVATAFDAAAKRELYSSLKARGAEGAVFKLLEAVHVPGRPASGGSQLKRKFTHRATFKVNGVHASKRSVKLALFDADGRECDVGNCTIPANHAVPATGALVDVEYLYAYRGGSVYQPQYKGERDDIDVSACHLSQLHYKTEHADEDEDTFL